jgi:hypothetical protein
MEIRLRKWRNSGTVGTVYIYTYSISYSVFHRQGCKMQIDKLVNLKEVNLSQFHTLEVGG